MDTNANANANANANTSNNTMDSNPLFSTYDDTTDVGDNTDNDNSVDDDNIIFAIYNSKTIYFNFCSTSDDNKVTNQQ